MSTRPTWYMPSRLPKVGEPRQAAVGTAPTLVISSRVVSATGGASTVQVPSRATSTSSSPPRKRRMAATVTFTRRRFLFPKMRHTR